LPPCAIEGGEALAIGGGEREARVERELAMPAACRRHDLEERGCEEEEWKGRATRQRGVGRGTAQDGAESFE